MNQLLRRIKELAQKAGAKSSKAGVMGGKSRDADRGGGKGVRNPGNRESQIRAKATGAGRISDCNPKIDMMEVRPTMRDLRALQVC